jgi:hypothetical protein
MVAAASRAGTITLISLIGAFSPERRRFTGGH